MATPVDGNKKLNFLIGDDVSDSGWVNGGGMESTLNYIRSYLENLQEGEQYEVVISRRDMTEAEIEAAPVI